jgi:hypothetical protein
MPNKREVKPAKKGERLPTFEAPTISSTMGGRKTFIMAGALTALVFFAGILIGMWLDSNRLTDIQVAIEDMNDRWNDARMQTLYYQTFENGNAFCDAALKSNLDFNTNIYNEGLKLEKYEEVNKFTPSLIVEKRKYALLQLQFWMNSVQLRTSCHFNYTTLVYLYSTNETYSMDQKLQSAVLLQAKEKCGDGLMLIPLPADLGDGFTVQTIELLKSNFNITTYPSIIINETVSLHGLKSGAELGSYISCLGK